jgi:hypothetical protein
MVSYKEGGFGLHLAFIDGDGRILRVTENPVQFTGESISNIVTDLQSASIDCKLRPLPYDHYFWREDDES